MSLQRNCSISGRGFVTKDKMPQKPTRKRSDKVYHRLEQRHVRLAERVRLKLLQFELRLADLEEGMISKDVSSDREGTEDE